MQMFSPAAPEEMKPSTNDSWRYQKLRRTFNPSWGFVFYIFVLSFILDPGGGIGLKYLATGLVFFSLLSAPKAISVPQSFWQVEFPLFVLLPLFAVVVGLAHGASLGSSLGQISFCLTW